MTTTAQSGNDNSTRLDDSTRREQLKLIYDYIKFHLGLYLSTPAVIGLLGRSFNVEKDGSFRIGLLVMIGVYLIAGIHAGWFVSNHVNVQWNSKYLDTFEKAAFSPFRIFMHHVTYWLGLFAGLVGLMLAISSAKHQ